LSEVEIDTLTGDFTVLRSDIKMVRYIRDLTNV
jgi:xanthine dehydrogenase molybdopterin-binding subunit B